MNADKKRQNTPKDNDSIFGDLKAAIWAAIGIVLSIMLTSIAIIQS